MSLIVFNWNFIEINKSLSEFYVVIIDPIIKLSKIFNCAIMKLINSILSDQIIEAHKVKVGEFYFLKNMVVAEIFEGAHIDFSVSKDYLNLIIDFYGREENFGYICNRINNFSISPLDYPKFNRALKNLTMYGIVHNNHFDRLNYDIEKRFCDKPYKAFSDLETAYNQIKIIIAKSELINNIIQL